MKLFLNYKHFLKNRKLTDTTVKNYLSDLKHFITWSAKNNDSIPLEKQFTSKQLRFYRLYLNKNGVSQSNQRRYFSSLKLFGQYLQNQGKIKKNPLINFNFVTPPPESAYQLKWTNLLDKYGKFLKKSGLSPITVKNYLSDVRQFIQWLEKNMADKNA